MGGGHSNTLIQFSENPLTVFGIDKRASLTQNLLDPAGLRQFAMPTLPKAWQAEDQDPAPAGSLPTVPGLEVSKSQKTDTSSQLVAQQQQRRAVLLSGYDPTQNTAPGLN